ncbi:hypothetical protein LMG31884_47660 (plasmid) [Xanthomonas hydrangeae]|uniref:type IV secretion system protein VirB10 n=1 Tax=Xanthomonas hydrangeae TaxID=2775159 RepID=UPI001963D7E9|nr:hypothetical protein LMG31884_47660 [Xanthomonas hydrangeae]CAD7741408.1 hypothetical protein LMG31884_47660 [Xanthomonas hydrangeae]CAD7747892.1 hypothetical protein LMG31887_46170 [Xanthomonas hydrangeae]CAD7747893.1 hypothetical protein LMG31887_46170 [Xanthomonas hydrangeae]CAD7748230.1 hypothetical protein LMG31885_45320 [Xanthomonas hydrangeae]
MAKANDADPASQDVAPADLGRGIPSLNAGGKGGIPGSIKLLIIVSIILAILGVAGTIALGKFKEMRDQRKVDRAEEAKTTAEVKMPQLTEKDFEDPPLPPQALANEGQGPAAPVGEGPGQHPAGQPGVPAQAGSGGQYDVPAMSPQEQYAQTLKERRLSAPLTAAIEQPERAQGATQVVPQTASNTDDAFLAALRASVPPNFGQNGATQAPQKSSLESSLESVNTSMSLATRLNDPSMTVTQGSLLPCSLDTALNSQLPGMVMCKLSLPIYGTDSRVVLLDRGTILTGQYQGAQLKQGMNRIFVLWTRAETPKGVIVSLDSPSSDGLGRSGIGGKVNNHFWARFGSGLLLSVVDDGLTYATQRRSQGDAQTLQFGSTSDTAKDAAAIAVENSVGIPPTQSTAQGSVVNVFVARDLYFGGVYGLRTADR